MIKGEYQRTNNNDYFASRTRTSIYVLRRGSIFPRCEKEKNILFFRKKKYRRQSDVNANQSMSLSLDSIRRLEKVYSEMHAAEHHVNENRHNCSMGWTSIEIISLHSSCADDEARVFHRKHVIYIVELICLSSISIDSNLAGSHHNYIVM